MDLIVEPAQFTKYLVQISVVHDELVVKDQIEDTWVIQEDELERFWATTVGLKNGSANPSVVVADVFWFLRVRPLLVLWKPGTWPLAL